MRQAARRRGFAFLRHLYSTYTVILYACVNQGKYRVLEGELRLIERC